MKKKEHLTEESFASVILRSLSTPAEPLPMAIDKWKLNTSLEAKLNYSTDFPEKYSGAFQI